MSDKERDELEETRKDVDEHKIRLALVEQSIIAIKDGMGEMKRNMSDFLAELRKNYVTRPEYDESKKRLDTLETRVWGLLVSVFLLAAGWVFTLLRG